MIKVRDLETGLVLVWDIGQVLHHQSNQTSKLMAGRTITRPTGSRAGTTGSRVTPMSSRIHPLIAT